MESERELTERTQSYTNHCHCFLFFFFFLFLTHNLPVYTFVTFVCAMHFGHCVRRCNQYSHTYLSKQRCIVSAVRASLDTLCYIKLNARYLLPLFLSLFFLTFNCFHFHLFACVKYFVRANKSTVSLATASVVRVIQCKCRVAFLIFSLLPWQPVHPLCFRIFLWATHSCRGGWSVASAPFSISQLFTSLTHSLTGWVAVSLQQSVVHDHHTLPCYQLTAFTSATLSLFLTLFPSPVHPFSCSHRAPVSQWPNQVEVTHGWPDKLTWILISLWTRRMWCVSIKTIGNLCLLMKSLFSSLCSPRKMWWTHLFYSPEFANQLH